VSLILDALNRSRQEDEAPTVPGLSSEHYSPASGARKTSILRWIPWLALALAVLVIVWLLIDRPATVPETPAATQGRQPDLTSRLPATPPQQEKHAAAGNNAELQREVPQSPAKTRETSEPRGEVPPVVKPLPEQDAAVAALYAQTGKETVGEAPEAPVESAAVVGEQGVTGQAYEVQQQPVDIEALLENTRQELEESRLAEHPAPFISDLSQQTKDRIPTIFYQRHDFSGSGATSSVVLNGKSLRLGGLAAAGVTVEEILPDSVVLSHQGTQFRLRALNSWINL